MGNLRTIKYPSVTKTYPASSNDDAQLLYKNEVERSSHSEDVLCERTKQADWLGKLKSKVVKLLVTTESICFCGCLPICNKSASELNSVLIYCRISFGN